MPHFQETLLKGAYKLDLTRLQNSLESMAHALYYHTHKKKCPWPIKIIPLSLFQSKDSLIERSPLVELMLLGANYFFESSPKLGENPDIFFYQIHLDEANEHFVIKMVFYNGFEVIALYSPSLA